MPGRFEAGGYGASGRRDAGGHYRSQLPGVSVSGVRAGKGIQEYHDSKDPEVQRLTPVIARIIRILNRYGPKVTLPFEEMLRSIPTFASAGVTWHQSPFRAIRINREVEYSVTAATANENVFTQIIAERYVGVIEQFGFTHEMIEGYDEVSWSFRNGGNPVEGLTAFSNQIGSHSRPESLGHPLIVSGGRTVTLVATNSHATFSHEGVLRIKGWIFQPRVPYDGTARGMKAD